MRERLSHSPVVLKFRGFQNGEREQKLIKNVYEKIYFILREMENSNYSQGEKSLRTASE